MPVAAAIGGAAISAIAASRASDAQSDAARDAAALTAQAQNRAIDLQERMFEQGRADLEPYRVAGNAALQRFAGIYGVNLAPVPEDEGVAQVPEQTTTQTPRNALEASIAGKTGGMVRGPDGTFVVPETPIPTAAAAVEDEAAGPAFEATVSDVDPIQASINQLQQLTAGFEESPGYQFRLDQGQKALERAANARGVALSGNALTEALQFGEGLAADEFNTFVNRRLGNFDQYANRLAALAGVGQSATNAGVQQGANFADSASSILQAGARGQSNALLAAGEAEAAGSIGIANAFNSGANNLLFLQGMQAGGPMTGGPISITGTVPFYGA